MSPTDACRNGCSISWGGHMSNSSCGSLEGFGLCLDRPERAFAKAMRGVIVVLGTASAPSMDTSVVGSASLVRYANPATAAPVVPQAIRQSSRQPVRRYSPEDWPYEPEADCQKDWDDAGE